MHERALGVHEIELVVDAGEHLSHRRGVGNHAHGAHDLGEVATGHHGRGLVVDAALETGGAPVHELDRALGLDTKQCFQNKNSQSQNVKIMFSK